MNHSLYFKIINFFWFFLNIIKQTGEFPLIPLQFHLWTKRKYSGDSLSYQNKKPQKSNACPSMLPEWKGNSKNMSFNYKEVFLLSK